jgi:glycolate oxidase FAD binding subunit
MSTSMLAAARADEIAAILRDATQSSTPLLVRGGGTKLTWRADARTDAALLSTHGLTGDVGHDPGDLVAAIPAGITLAQANEVLAAAGQWLPLDCANAQTATIGGIVAANDSGPRRLRHGAPRDLVIGMEAALATGEVVHAGGRVVKNVAGYDLSRLFCGSLGTLGVLTRVTFKLAPLAASSRTVRARAGSIGEALDMARLFGALPLTPSALDLAAPDPHLLVRFESSMRATEQMAHAAADAVRTQATDVAVLSDASETEAWQAHERRTQADGRATRLKISVPPTAQPSLIDALRQDADRHGLELSLVARASLGVVYVNVTGAVAHHAEWALDAERHARRAGGHAVALAFAEAASPVSIGAPPSAIRELMAGIARQFDPANVLGGREHFAETA